MGYNDLSESGMDPDGRRAEASRILKTIGLLDKVCGEGKPNEVDFVRKASDERKPISTKELFWLRDLKEKYL